MNYAVGRLPIDAWDQHEQLLLQSGKVDKSVKERIERRRRLAAMDGEQLMEKLEEFSDGNDGKDSSELDHAQLEDLLEALAAKQHPEPAELRRLLENEFARDEWTHTHLVELAGIRRMDEFVPLLTEYLAYDEDEVLQEAAQRALSLIGNRNVVELIRARFPEYSWETKLYASGVLGAIHDESAEKTILELLRSERDGSSRARLCIALGDQFSHAGIEAISRELRDPGDLDGHREVDLEESLLALSLALDVDIPERRGLLLARLERDQHFDSLVDRDDFAFFDDSDDDEVEFEDDDEVEFEDDDWVEPDGFAEEPPIPRPIVASRVPRPNERCPCGSGKKYKRCCQNA